MLSGSSEKPLQGILSSDGLRNVLGQIVEVVERIQSKRATVSLFARLHSVAVGKDPRASAPAPEEFWELLNRGIVMATKLRKCRAGLLNTACFAEEFDKGLQQTQHFFAQCGRLQMLMRRGERLCEEVGGICQGLKSRQDAFEKQKDALSHAGMYEFEGDASSCWGPDLVELLQATSALYCGGDAPSRCMTKLWRLELEWWLKKRGDQRTDMQGEKLLVPIEALCRSLAEDAAAHYKLFFKAMSMTSFGKLTLADLGQVIGGLSPAEICEEVAVANKFVQGCNIQAPALQVLEAGAFPKARHEKMASINKVMKMVGGKASHEFLEFMTLSSDASTLALHLHVKLKATVDLDKVEMFAEGTSLCGVLDELGKAEGLFEFLRQPDVAALDFSAIEEIVDEEYGDHPLNISTVTSLAAVRESLRVFLDGKKTTKKGLDWFITQLEKVLAKDPSIARKLAECTEQLLAIKERLQSSETRTEKTRHVVHAALHGGEMIAELDECGLCQPKLMCNTNVYDQERLADLRSRSQLLSNKQAEASLNSFDQAKESAQKNELLVFAELVDRMFDIARLLTQLNFSGNVTFKKGKVKSGTLRPDSVVATLEDINTRRNELESELREWRGHEDQCRSSYFYLNFFWARQLWVLETLVTTPFDQLSPNDRTNAIALLYFINPKLPAEDVVRKISPEQRTSIQVFDILPRAGQELETFLGNDPWDHSKRPFIIAASTSRESVVIEGQLFVAVLEEGSPKLLSTILSLYYNSVKSLPSPSQILFCDRDTELPEALLFLSRCAEAAKRGIHAALFCLVLPEKLSDHVRFALVRRLQEVLASRLQIRLAMICARSSRGRNHLIDQFYEFSHSRIPVPNDSLISDAFCRQFPRYRTLTSEGPGLGKTERARELAAKSGKRLVTLSVSGPLTRQRFVESLHSLPLSAKHALHLDIGHVSDFELLDVLVFELLVLTTVSAGTQTYHLPVQDVFMEIANTLANKLLDSLTVASWLPCECLSWENFDNFKVSAELLSPVQVVCNYLDAHYRCSVESTDLIFWPPHPTVRSLPADQCRRLLSRFLTGIDLNFSLLHSWFNVLSDQLLKLSASSFFRVAQLSGMVGGRSEAFAIRRLLVEMLLKSSREYATRSVVSSRDSQEEALSLATGAKALRELASHGHSASVEEMVGRVKGMVKWDETNHLLVLFNSSHAQTITILYRRLDDVSSEVRENIKRLVEPQGYVLSTRRNAPLLDFETLKQGELLELLCRISRPPSLPKLEQCVNGYALTSDNLLKMALIIQRVRAHVPVVIMGETGCGKTSLVRFLSRVCNVEFDSFSVHAGRSYSDIEKFVRRSEEKARSQGRQKVWIFLDEINTCDHLGLLSDIICRHQIRGKPLSRQLVFIAACNPYRQRLSAVTSVGLSLPSASLHAKKGEQRSDMSTLVYKVHPLPEAMMDFVWDYGSLEPGDEAKYIDQMVEIAFADCKKSLRDVRTAKILSAAHKFMREHDRVHLTVSLRDVHRCLQLMKWWFEETQKLSRCKCDDPLLGKAKRSTRKLSAVPPEIEACVVGVGLCYESRLVDPNVRWEFRSKIVQQLPQLGRSGDVFHSILKLQQMKILARMEKKPPGTAVNGALLENVFVMLVSIVNKIPVFVVGKPGSSKSLAMRIIKDNVVGPKSQDEYLKKLPALSVIPYQGSTSSTSEGIRKVFEHASKTRDNCLSVVLLDEIGLAEASPSNPLKVLHSLLEPEDGSAPTVGVVGISNFLLDAAKMNRAIQLSRPDPTEEDLRETAQSIRDSYKNSDQAMINDSLLEEELKRLANAYLAHQKMLSSAEYRNFHGLRDFYHLVKSICVRFARERGEVDTHQRHSILLGAFWRNFGGLPERFVRIEREYFDSEIVPESDLKVKDLIAENLNDKDARHLLLLTKGDSGLSVLREMLEDMEKTPRIMYGSKFDDDQVEAYAYNKLSEIILCMESGGVLVLSQLDPVYGSLYDMLNQSYTLIGGKRLCRVALGAFSNPLCPVSDDFRCVVILDQDSVRDNDDDRAFLNRFEKQRLGFSSVIDANRKEMIDAVSSWVDNFSKIVEGERVVFNRQDAFAGFSEDTISSLVLHHCHLDGSSQDVLDSCKSDLLRIVPPDAVWRVFQSSLDAPEKTQVFAEYMQQQRHGLERTMLALKAVAAASQPGVRSSDWVGRNGGMKVLVMTYNNILQTDIAAMMKPSPFTVETYKLGAYRSEKQLTDHVKLYLANDRSDLFILQCHSVTDGNHLLLAQFTLDHLWREFPDPPCAKHMCIILHMPRSEASDEHGSSAGFSFQCGWKQVFLDSLEPCPLLCQKFSKMSISEALCSDLIPCKAIVRQHLQHVLLRALSSANRTAEELVQLAADIKQRPGLIELFADICVSYINEDPQREMQVGQIDSAPLAWQVEVASNRTTLVQSQSFSSALEARVTGALCKFFTRLLLFIDEQGLFDFLRQTGDDLEDSAHRFALAARLLKATSLTRLDRQVSSATKLKLSSSKARNSRFPMSSIFLERMENHRSTFIQNVERYENTHPDLLQKACVHKAMPTLIDATELAFREIQNAKESPKWSKDFLCDFLEEKTAMYGLEKDLRNQLLLCLLEPYWTPECLQQGGDLVTMAAYAHGAFWLAEPFVQPVMLLANRLVRSSGDKGKKLQQSLTHCSELYHCTSRPMATQHDANFKILSQCESSTGAAAFLLANFCLFLLKFVPRSTDSQKKWCCAVLQFLSLSSQLPCEKPPILYLLRICSDVKSFFGNSQIHDAVTQFTVSLAKCGAAVQGLSDLHPSLLPMTLEFVRGLPSSASQGAGGFLLLFFSHWLDAAGENPDHIDIILSYLRGSYSSDRNSLISPILHRILLRVENQTSEMLSVAFAVSSDFSQEPDTLSALENCLADCLPGDPFTVILCDTIQKLTPFKNLVKEKSPDDALRLLKAAFRIVSDTKELSYRCLAAVSAIRQILAMVLSVRQLSLQPRQRTEDVYALFHQDLDLLLKLALSETANLSEERLECVTSYIGKLFFDSNEKQRLFGPLVRGRLTSLETVLDAVLLPEQDDIQSTVNALVLVDAFKPVRDTLLQIIADKLRPDVVSQLLNDCLTDTEDRRALLCALGQVLYLKGALRGRKHAEDKVARAILGCEDLLQQLPEMYVESLKSVLQLKSRFNVRLLQQVSSDPDIVNLLTVLIHFLSILSASSVANVSETASPLLQLFLKPNSDAFTVGEASDLASGPSCGADVCAVLSLTVCCCGTVYTRPSEDAPCPNTSCKLRTARSANSFGCLPSTVRVPTHTVFGNDQRQSRQVTRCIDFKQLSQRSFSFFLPDRQLSPLHFHVLSFLKNAAAFLGLAVTNTVNLPRLDEKLTEVLGITDEDEYPERVLENHLKGNWSCLQALTGSSSDDVSLLLHGVLIRCADVLVEGQDERVGLTTERLFKWEEKFVRFSLPVLGQPQAFIRAQRRSFLKEIGEACHSVRERELVDTLYSITETADMDKTPSEKSFSCLFRQMTVPTKLGMISAFFSSRQHGQVFPVLALFLRKHEELSLLRFLPPLLNWDRFVRSCLSGRLTREEIKKLTVHTFLSSAGQDVYVPYEVQEKGWDLMNELVDAWEGFANHLAKFPNVKLKLEDDFQENTLLISTIVDSSPESSKFWQAIVFLRDIQNTFLATVMKVCAELSPTCLEFLTRSDGSTFMPSVSLGSARKEIVCFDEEDLFRRLLIFSQVSPGYGRGREVRYDFDRIQREVINELVTCRGFLSLSEDEPTAFPYFDEHLAHQYTAILDVKRAIPQVELSSEQEKLADKLRELERRQLKIDLDTMLSLAPRVCNDPDASLAGLHRKLLGNSSRLSLGSLLPELQVKHIVAIYEAVEATSRQLELAIDNLASCFRENLPSRALERLRSALDVTIPAKEFLDLLQRLAFRELQSSDESERKRKTKIPLLDFVSDVHAWPLSAAAFLLQEVECADDNHTQDEFQTALSKTISPDVTLAHTHSIALELRRVIEEVCRSREAWPLFRQTSSAPFREPAFHSSST